MELVTGLHIGGSSDFSAIGAIDSPVIRDAFTTLPMIPGSSLKGKIRSLLVKKYNETGIPAERPDGDAPEIKRLFGSMGEKSRLIFSDMIMSNMDELRKYGIESPTESKHENAINRLSGVANPRQIERVIRGSKFPCDIIYNVQNEDEMEADIALLAEGLRFLQYDYLGGHGSRGYGKVVFRDLTLKVLVGDVSEEKLQACRKHLEDI